MKDTNLPGKIFIRAVEITGLAKTVREIYFLEWSDAKAFVDEQVAAEQDDQPLDLPVFEKKKEWPTVDLKCEGVVPPERPVLYVKAVAKDYPTLEEAIDTAEARQELGLSPKEQADLDKMKLKKEQVVIDVDVNEKEENDPFLSLVNDLDNKEDKKEIEKEDKPKTATKSTRKKKAKTDTKEDKAKKVEVLTEIRRMTILIMDAAEERGRNYRDAMCEKMVVKIGRFELNLESLTLAEAEGVLAGYKEVAKEYDIFFEEKVEKTPEEAFND